MKTIQYKGQDVPLKVTTGSLFRFEGHGYTLEDFALPGRQIRAAVAFLGSIVDPQASLEEVADNLPTIQEINAAAADALGESGLLEDEAAEPGDGVSGNFDGGGETSEPSPDSNSGSTRKTLRPQAQES